MSSFHLSERVDTCEVSESDEEGDKVIRQFVTKFYWSFKLAVLLYTLGATLISVEVNLKDSKILSLIT